MNEKKFVDPRKLSPEDARQIPPWLRHFIVYVVKQCAAVVVAWCEQMQQATKESDKEANSH